MLATTEKQRHHPPLESDLLIRALLAARCVCLACGHHLDPINASRGVDLSENRDFSRSLGTRVRAKRCISFFDGVCVRDDFFQATFIRFQMSCKHTFTLAPQQGRPFFFVLTFPESKLPSKRHHIFDAFYLCVCTVKSATTDARYRHCTHNR